MSAETANLATRATRMSINEPNEPGSSGVMNFPQGSEEAKEVLAQILKDNHDNHHIFFNDKGFHNHIPHYLLALYDFGCTAEVLRATYEREKTYQRSAPALHERVMTDLSDESTWDKYFGKYDHYTDFRDFFAKEIEEIGWRQCVNKRLFSRTPNAEKLFKKLLSGLYHPLVQLGYGIEFEIPMVIAEGLAQAATEEAWADEQLLEVEKKAYKEDPTGEKSQRTINSLSEEVRQQSPIPGVAPYRSEPSEFISLFQSAVDNLAPILTQVRCTPSNLYEYAAQSTNSATLNCAGAIRPDKAIIFDFVFIHMVTSCLMLHVLLNQDWIDVNSKCRIVEWKTRHDLAVYAGQGAPKLYVDEIKNYVPKEKGKGNPWLNVIERCLVYNDRTAGHGIKMIRALAYAERISGPYAGKRGFVFEGDMWLKFAAMCIDSLEEGGDEWLYGAGFDESWEKVGPRKRYGEA